VYVYVNNMLRPWWVDSDVASTMNKGFSSRSGKSWRVDGMQLSYDTKTLSLVFLGTGCVIGSNGASGVTGIGDTSNTGADEVTKINTLPKGLTIPTHGKRSKHMETEDYGSTFVRRRKLEREQRLRSTLAGGEEERESTRFREQVRICKSILANGISAGGDSNAKTTNHKILERNSALFGMYTTEGKSAEDIAFDRMTKFIDICVMQADAHPVGEVQYTFMYNFIRAMAKMMMGEEGHEAWIGAFSVMFGWSHEMAKKFLFLCLPRKMGKSQTMSIGLRGVLELLPARVGDIVAQGRDGATLLLDTVTELLLSHANAHPEKNVQVTKRKSPPVCTIVSTPEHRGPPHKLRALSSNPKIGTPSYTSYSSILLDVFLCKVSCMCLCLCRVVFFRERR